MLYFQQSSLKPGDVHDAAEVGSMLSRVSKTNEETAQDEDGLVSSFHMLRICRCMLHVGGLLIELTGRFVV